MHHPNTNQDRVEVALSISDKVDFKPRRVIRDKERHGITIKGSVLQEDKTALTVYAPNSRAAKRISKN